MKRCQTCGQALAEPVKVCPNCGSEMADTLEGVDDYKILEIVHEEFASIVCRAIKEGEETPVALRLFTAYSGVNEAVAERLSKELVELQKLPEAWFVRHHAIRRSSEGTWYRVSEWVQTESWGNLLTSGRLQDASVVHDFFIRLSSILEGLHQSGHIIPHLILNDILVLEGESTRIDVKLDYKLSRFLDPQISMPGPMLQNLLDCHPDIIGKRPLDFKSDIWSLGRIFVQIISGKLEIDEPRSLLETVALPKDMETLLRSMLAEDPSLRPDSMQEVSDTLKRIKYRAAEERTSSPDAASEISRLRKTLVACSWLFVLVVACAGVFLFWYRKPPVDDYSVFEEYANRYAGSIAFVMVQYQIRVENMVVYRQKREGTAFLVDPDGYLLTNRHVACPWLEDHDLFKLINRIEEIGKTPRLEYRMYLWFEGYAAFNRLVGIEGGNEIEDIYNLASAYRRGGKPGVAIAGVARFPVGTRRIVQAPLRDDYAVLKISRVPSGLLPLPLDRTLNTSSLKRLSPVIALGFPLGSSIQTDVINVSVTRGHIRRTFENFFQVDTSIYKGNSGGPIIDRRGRVIGIASAVATDVAVAPLPVITLLSDIGLVLPVTDAVTFIDELKQGKPKWNGVLDLSVSSKIKTITETAIAGRWLEAQRLANQYLEDSDAPTLLMAAAVMHFCNKDMDGSAGFLDRVLSIDADNYQARFMRYLIDWTNSPQRKSSHLDVLRSLDWRSPGELFGYLATILNTGPVDKAMLDGWNTRKEKSWIYLIAGLRAKIEGDASRSHELIKLSALSAERDDWPLYLALAELYNHPANKTQDPRVLRDDIMLNLSDREAQVSRLKPLLSEFGSRGSDPANRLDIISAMLEVDPENKMLRALLSYHAAMIADWSEALSAAEAYLEMGGREEPLRMGVGLLAAVIVQHLDKIDDSRARLRAYCSQTGISWYRQIGETLLGNRSVEDLIENAGAVPEKILTGYTALGFQAEAQGELDLAVRYYREALGSYLDDWIEYELARQRYIVLRRNDDR
jgi:S1-C subfamily serine protease